VFEVPEAGEEHGNAAMVRGVDGLSVADRSPWLYYRGYAGLHRALAGGAELVPQIDRDFSHDARDLPRLIAAASEEVDIAYICSAGEGEERAALASALTARRGEELRRGTTLVGPHRDDLRLAVNGIDLRTFGSRGQQHTAALSLRLAEAEMLREDLGEWPVLLLDDVLADLDRTRQAFLLDEMAGPQVLLTHTGAPPDGGPTVSRDGGRGGGNGAPGDTGVVGRMGGSGSGRPTSGSPPL